MILQKNYWLKNKKEKQYLVLAQSGFEMKILKKVGKENFTPNPKIDSAIMLFSRKDTFFKRINSICEFTVFI